MLSKTNAENHPENILIQLLLTLVSSLSITPKVAVQKCLLP